MSTINQNSNPNMLDVLVSAADNFKLAKREKETVKKAIVNTSRERLKARIAKLLDKTNHVTTFVKERDFKKEMRQRSKEFRIVKTRYGTIFIRIHLKNNLPIKVWLIARVKGK